MQSAGRAGGRLCAGASNRSYVRTSVLRSRQIPSPDFSNYRGRHGGDFADRPGETRRAYRQDGRAARRRLSEKSPRPAGRVRKPARRVEALNRSPATRSEEQTSELQSLMRTSYAVFCLKKKK